MDTTSFTPLPEKPTKKVLFTGFIENQFIVVKTGLGSDLINLSAFALKWMRSTPNPCSASSDIGPGTLSRRPESKYHLNPGQPFL